MVGFQIGISASAFLSLLAIVSSVEERDAWKPFVCIPIAAGFIIALSFYVELYEIHFKGFWVGSASFVVFFIGAMYAFDGVMSVKRDRLRKVYEKNKADAEKEMKRIEAIRIKTSEFFAALVNEWPIQSDGRTNVIMRLMAKNDFSYIRLIKYNIHPNFSVITDDILSIKNIISAKTHVPMVISKKERVEIVPVSIQHKKSSFKRAVVGGVLLGPAGAVIGAASGLGGGSSIINEERIVREEVLVPGPPILTLGTTAPDLPMIEITFPNDAKAAELWLHRLRAAKMRSRTQHTGAVRSAISTGGT